MGEFKYAEIEVDGKKLKDWLQSDEGLVDYSKTKARKNVSNTKGIVIYDLGDYVFDTDVRPQYYCNGVDLSKVAAVARYEVSYDGMSLKTALDGDDHARVFVNSFENPTVEDFVIYFFQLLEGDVYISETSYRVYVKGRIPADEAEWKAAVDELYSRNRHNKSK